MKWHRIWGLMLRYLYSFNRTVDRWVDAFYWPALDTTVWGITISAFHIAPEKISMVISGLILWYVLWRGQYEITLNILEEFWHENLTNLLSTPIKLSEWICSLFLLSIIKLVLTLTFMTILSYVLYSVNIFRLGFYLIPFILSLLMMGWLFGLFVGGLFLRHGTKIQSLAWAGGFLLMPFSATFFPQSVLPSWAQVISHALPSSYIFEGMRMILFTQTLSISLLVKSFLLNGVYFLLALWFFYRSYSAAKKKGFSHIK